MKIVYTKSLQFWTRLVGGVVCDFVCITQAKLQVWHTGMDGL